MVGRGGIRNDLLEQGLPLCAEYFRSFAYNLKMINEEAANKLLNLIIAALDDSQRYKIRKENDRARRLHEVGLRVSQLVFMALSRAIKPHTVRYELARLLYAHSDVYFQEHARRRGSLLKPKEVEAIAKALEKTLTRHELPSLYVF